MFPDAGRLLQEQNLQSHWRLPHVEQCTCFLFSVDRSWYNWCLSLSQLYKTLEEPFETCLRQISRLLPVKMHTYGRFKFLTSETMRCDRPGCPCSECQGSRQLSQPTRTWWRAEQEVKRIFQISNIMILQLAISTNSRSHIGIHLYIYIFQDAPKEMIRIRIITRHSRTGPPFFTHHLPLTTWPPPSYPPNQHPPHIRQLTQYRPPNSNQHLYTTHRNIFDAFGMEATLSQSDM